MATLLRRLLWHDDDGLFSGSTVRKLPYATVAIPLFFAHLALSQLGWSLLSGTTLTPVWPAAGLDLVVLLVFGPRFWPVLFAAYFMTTFGRAVTWAPDLGMSFANSLRPLIGVWLFNAISKKKIPGAFRGSRRHHRNRIAVAAGASGTRHGDPDSGRHLPGQPMETGFEPLVDRGCARHADPDAGPARARQVGRGPRCVLRSKSDRQDSPAGRGSSGRMLLRLFPSRGFLSALLRVPVDPVLGGLGGTSGGPRQRAGDCVRRGMGHAHRRGSVRRRHGPGKSPEPELVSCGRIADWSRRRGVPDLGQPVAAWHASWWRDGY